MDLARDADVADVATGAGAGAAGAGAGLVGSKGLKPGPFRTLQGEIHVKKWVIYQNRVN